MYTNTPMTRFHSEARRFWTFIAACILLAASLLCISTYNGRRRLVVIPDVLAAKAGTSKGTSNTTKKYIPKDLGKKKSTWNEFTEWVADFHKDKTWSKGTKGSSTGKPNPMRKHEIFLKKAREQLRSEEQRKAVNNGLDFERRHNEMGPLHLPYGAQVVIQHRGLTSENSIRTSKDHALWYGKKGTIQDYEKTERLYTVKFHNETLSHFDPQNIVPVEQELGPLKLLYGAIVTIQDLKSVKGRPMNGMQGTIECFDEKPILGQQVIDVKPKNFFVHVPFSDKVEQPQVQARSDENNSASVPAPPLDSFRPGTRVVIQGFNQPIKTSDGFLTDGSSLNGEKATIECFYNDPRPEKCHYRVMLDNLEVINVNPENVVPVEQLQVQARSNE